VVGTSKSWVIIIYLRDILGERMEQETIVSVGNISMRLSVQNSDSSILAASKKRGSRARRVSRPEDK